MIPTHTVYTANFITDEQAVDLVSFLNEEDFADEGSRKVSSYGEQYQYNGSNSTPNPIPEQMSWIADKIKSEFNLQYDLNQVLVNKYESSAELPPHSDNEGSIDPESSIYTISLSSPGIIEFTHKNSEAKQELTVEPNSLYSMSQHSQNFYKHHVIQNSLELTRYSITLRSVHWAFYNSTYYAVGDSNFGRIEFGSGRGKVGKATPGMRDWAPCVKDIKPSRCASYRNVVLMCGTNDSKDSQCDILKTYQCFKGKIEEIKEINKSCKIFVCPVLPSRDKNLNREINAYNKYLFSDLVHSHLSVNIVQGFDEFADYYGFLKPALHDERNHNDVLHINGQGYCILVRLLKHAIFSVKTNKGVTSRLFSHVVRPG